MKSKMYTFWMKEEPDQLAKSKIWSWYPEPWRSQHLALLGCKSTIRLGGLKNPTNLPNQRFGVGARNLGIRGTLRRSAASRSDFIFVDESLSAMIFTNISPTRKGGFN